MLDVRLETGKGSDFPNGNIVFKVSQRVVPLYKAQYYTVNDVAPTFEAVRTNIYSNRAKIDFNTTNLKEDEWYSLLDLDKTQYYMGKLVKVVHTGFDEQDSFCVTQKAVAEDVKVLIKTPQSTEYTVGPGKFTDNNVTYHWTIEGNYKTPKIAKFRQELKVKFDPNAGKYSGANFKYTNKGAEQVIGHSMKVGESFADINAISVPTDDDIVNVPKYTDPTSHREIDQKLLGWVLEADKSLDFTNGQNSDKLIKFNEHEVKNDETFYAVYGPKDEGEADISYKFVDKSSGTEKLSPIPDSVKKDVKLVEKLYGNVGDAVIKDTEEFKKTLPTFVGYKLRENNPVVFDDTAKTKFEKNNPVKLSVVYEKLPDVIKKETGKATPAGYIDITFKAGKNSKISNANVDVVYSVNPKAEVKVQKDTNKYVLLGKKADNQELKLDVPEVTAEAGYKLNTANQGWNYDNFEKVGKAITTATTFTSVVVEKKQWNSKTKIRRRTRTRNKTR